MKRFFQVKTFIIIRIDYLLLLKGCLLSQKWICISTCENAEITHIKGIWGVAQRFRKSIDRVQIGDLLLVYTRQIVSGKNITPSAITGIFEVTSEEYEDNTPIFETPEWMGNEKFPFRVKVKPIKIFKEPIIFRSLVSNLSFIKNKKNWQGYIRTAMREISDNDFDYIIQSQKRDK